MAHRVMDYEDDKPKPGGKWIAEKLFYAQPNIEFCPKCKRVVKFCTCEVKDGVVGNKG